MATNNFALLALTVGCLDDIGVQHHWGLGTCRSIAKRCNDLIKHQAQLDGLVDEILLIHTQEWIEFGKLCSSIDDSVLDLDMVPRIIMGMYRLGKLQMRKTGSRNQKTELKSKCG